MDGRRYSSETDTQPSCALLTVNHPSWTVKTRPVSRKPCLHSTGLDLGIEAFLGCAPGEKHVPPVLERREVSSQTDYSDVVKNPRIWRGSCSASELQSDLLGVPKTRPVVLENFKLLEQRWSTLVAHYNHLGAFKKTNRLVSPDSN